MKFVFLSHNYSPDVHSPEDWFERIKIYTGSLTCLSKEHTVIRIERINYTGSCLHKGVQYYFTGYRKGKNYFPWKLHRFVQKQEPDIVVVAGLHYPWQVIQLRWRLGRRIKIIVQNHGEKPFLGNKKYVQRWADRCIDAYFFSSSEMGLDWVKKGNLGSPGKIHEVMEVSSAFLPTDRKEALMKSGVTGHPVFLWVGRLDKNKNPLMVIRAFLEFAPSRPGSRLYMIYHTTELLSEIEELLDEKPGNRETIVLTGSLPHARLPDWYGSADFIVSGSWHEGGGTAVCEALSCGCVPVLTDIFSFRMMTGKGRCGLLYEPGSQAALVSALRATDGMNMPEERRKVLEQFRRELSFEAIAAKIYEVAVSL
jgi:glycosyltransferase involved in cell wall biosynthesis